MRRLLIATLLVGCNARHHNPQAGINTVTDADREAWKGQSVAELDRHPKFSLLPRHARPLSDGSEMWDFVDCSTTQPDLHCSSQSNKIGATVLTNTSCDDHGSRTFCCHNQFFVRAGIVEEYRPSGSNCLSSCSAWPGGTCEKRSVVTTSSATDAGIAHESPY